MKCEICRGEQVVCENHPAVAWGYGVGCDCRGAGKPCECTCKKVSAPKKVKKEKKIA